MKSWLAFLIVVSPFSVHAKHALDSTVIFASIPSPGFPESVARDRSGNIYVTGPSSPTGTAGLPPSRVWKYNHRGALLTTYEISGEDTAADHNALGLALDSRGRMYVATSQLGIVRLDPSTCPPTQIAYSAGQLPVLPLCSVTVTANCSFVPMGPLANGLAFDPNTDDLIVTDFFQGAFWRVPWGGGAPSLWYQDPLLSGYGPNGLAVNACGTKLYFVHTQFPDGAIYTVNLFGTPVRKLFHQFTATGPDGMALGANGKVYVAAPPFNEIVVVDADGTEERRITSVLMDGPTGMAFTRNGSLFVTSSSAMLRIPENMAILDVYVHDSGAPVYLP